MRYYALCLLASLQFVALPFALEYAPAPGSPPNLIGISAAILTADVSQQGIPANVQVISGAPSVTNLAVNSVTSWRFRNETRIERPVSVTLLFRPATVYPAEPMRFGPFENRRPQPRDLPPMPALVIDPGFPPDSIAQGPVVLQVDVGANGTPEQVREIGAGSALGQVAINAVRQWKFQPATHDGRPVEGTAIAVISFLRPVV